MKDCCDNCKHGETCCDEEKPSGRLFARRGERSATRYYPLRQSDGTILVVAAQGMQNEKEIFQLGLPYAAQGDGVFFETHQAAKRSLYKRLKADGDPKPGRAFGAFVAHVDPRGLTMDRRIRASKGVQVVPSGLSSARMEGELAGDRDVERLLVSLSKRYGSFEPSSPGVRVVVRQAIKDSAEKAAKRRYRDASSVRAFIDGYQSKAEARAFRMAPSGAMGVAPSGNPTRVVGIAVAGVGVVTLAAAAVSHFYLRDRVRQIATDALARR